MGIFVTTQKKCAHVRRIIAITTGLLISRLSRTEPNANVTVKNIIREIM
jgi:hypothetical protein